MSKVLSIVVPAYNAEKYLESNLQSFCISELLSEIEVIIVNDGSTDRTLEIAERYTGRHPDTYRVLSKENGGHGSGINTGISHATGKYFKVVDADDWVEREPFVKLVGELKKGNSDIVYSGFLWAFDNGEIDIQSFKRKSEFEEPFKNVVFGQEYCFDQIADSLYIKMHNMTIKTEILKHNGIRIDENCYYVDAEYITYPLPYVRTISFVNAFVYMYRIGRQGQSVGIEKMQQYEQNYDKVISSLLDFHGRLGTQITCSDAKKTYIEGIIARIVAGKIKIMLSFPATKSKKRELREFDEGLYKQFPCIYRHNINKAVSILRKSRYLTYPLFSIMVRTRY